MKTLLIPLLLFWSASVVATNLSKTAENKVSATTKVITYTVQNGTTSNVSDTQPKTALSSDQSDVLNHLKSIEGVQSVYFDGATNTYTVVSNLTTEFPNSLTFE